ncbi:MAG TPA: hypothetical protein VKS79_21210 [Gemmataceae bacterium]|nr:hypothetical protein [Gemmataceae bacterium]
MSSTGKFLSKNAVTYRNVGTYSSPVWLAILNIRDQKTPTEKDEFNASTRGGGAYYLVVGTLIKHSAEWSMNYDTADADWLALQSSFLNLTAIELMVLDQATGGSQAQGWRASYEVMKFEDGLPLDGMITTEVVAKPTISAHAPAWVTGL